MPTKNEPKNDPKNDPNKEPKKSYAAAVEVCEAKWEAAVADGTGGSESFVPKVFGLGLDTLKDLAPAILAIATTPESRRGMILTLVEQFYDKYIEPLDLPWIPNVIEPIVDSGLKLLLSQLVGRAYDAFVTAEAEKKEKK